MGLLVSVKDITSGEFGNGGDIGGDGESRPGMG